MGIYIYHVSPCVCLGQSSTTYLDLQSKTSRSKGFALYINGPDNTLYIHILNLFLCSMLMVPTTLGLDACCGLKMWCVTSTHYSTSIGSFSDLICQLEVSETPMHTKDANSMILSLQISICNMGWSSAEMRKSGSTGQFTNMCLTHQRSCAFGDFFPHRPIDNEGFPDSHV